MIYYGFAVLALCFLPLAIALIGAFRETHRGRTSVWRGSRGSTKV